MHRKGCQNCNSTLTQRSKPTVHGPNSSIPGAAEVTLIILAPKLNLSRSYTEARKKWGPQQRDRLLEMIDKILLSYTQKWAIIKRLYHLCNLERETQASLPTRAPREKD